MQSPMTAAVWEVALANHPDVPYRDYLVKGLHHGFRIGFGYGSLQCASAGSNMQSAEVRPNVIADFLASELRDGRVLGPVAPAIAEAVHVNRFGLVPKGHQPGKWRLIVDLSFPAGRSVNDGIDTALCSLHYTSVDEACRRVHGLGCWSYASQVCCPGCIQDGPSPPMAARHAMPG